MIINFVPKNVDAWLKWPAPGLTFDEACALSDHLAEFFGWISHYVEPV